jgi:hypothetical protein
MTSPTFHHNINRHDGVSLAHAFDGHLTLPRASVEEIEEEEEEEEQQLDLAWGIRNGYLCDILGAWMTPISCPVLVFRKRIPSSPID